MEIEGPRTLPASSPTVGREVVPASADPHAPWGALAMPRVSLGPRSPKGVL